MKNLLKNLNLTKGDFVFFALIILLFFGTRLINLLIIPIFTDEAIYLRWSQIMAHDASLRYLPLSDGKPPLFMWLVSFAIRGAPFLDYLFAGRLVAVFAGFFGLIGVYFTSRVLFKEKLVANFAAIFYLIIPFTLFYDRIALADSLLAAFGIWSIGLGVLLAKTLRLDVALILGWIIGLGLLTKTPAIFFIMIQPLLFFTVRKFKFADIVKFLLLVGVAFVESQIIFSILRLFPLFHMLGQKNHEFTLSLAEFLQNPFALFFGNIKSLLSWEVGYLTIPVVILILFAVVMAIKKRFLPPLILTLIFLGFVISMASFNKVIFVRYLLTFTPALFLVAAYGLFELQALIKNKYFKILAIAFFFVWPITISMDLLTNPIQAQIPKSDSDQYLHSWPAGFGVVEVRDYLANVPGKSIVLTEGTFGLMPYALELYQSDYPNTQIKPYWPLPNTPPEDILKSSKDTQIFVLMYQNQNKPANWNMTEVLRFRQGNGNDYLRLYKLNR